jgi:transcriptional regulator with XRE-family HTH domain
MPTKSADPLEKMIGQHIRFHRLRKRISQTKLGKSIGVTFQQVQKYENGTNRVPGSRLIRIAPVLGVPIGTFFGELQDEVASALTLANDRQAFRLIEAFSRIRDEKVRAAVVQIVEEIASSKQKETSERSPGHWP